MTQEIQNHNLGSSHNQKKSNSNKMFHPLGGQQQSFGGTQQHIPLGSQGRGYSPQKGKWKTAVANNLPNSTFAVLSNNNNRHGGMNSYMGGVSVQGSTYPRSKVGKY